jgi:hypothetical protein
MQPWTTKRTKAMPTTSYHNGEPINCPMRYAFVHTSSWVGFTNTIPDMWNSGVRTGRCSDSLSTVQRGRLEETGRPAVSFVRMQQNASPSPANIKQD